MEKIKIGRFDQVKILTTKRVSYLSAPPGTKTSPAGLWSVVSAIGDNELLLAQKSILIRIPVIDVLLVVRYDIHKLTQDLGRLSYGKIEKSNSNCKGSEATY